MKEENTTLVENKNETSKIDAIKQLIFGEQIQTYDSEFETLKKDILEKRNQLEDLIETVKSELLQNIDSVATDINIRITELEEKVEDKIDSLEETKVDRKMLGELLTKLGEKISQ
jgi:hypothetical protein